MASGITLKSTNDSIVNIKNVGTTAGTTEVTVPNRNMTMGTEITLGTAQATTSGTFKDFTIPSGVKRVTVMFDGVSTNGTSHLLVQLGDNDGIETTGYIGESGITNGALTASSTVGFPIYFALATRAIAGAMTISKIESNTFVENGTARMSTDQTCTFGGSKTLSSELTTVRITTVNGTDLFDAGTVNVSWEF